MNRRTSQKNKVVYSIFLLWIFLSLRLTCFGQIPQHELQLWLRADKGVLVKDDSIIRWRDHSGHQNDAFITTPIAPKLHQNSINHFSSIQFDGKTGGFQTKRISTFSKKRGSIFLVLKVNGASERSSVGVGNVLSTYHGRGNSWQFCASVKKFSFYDGLNALYLENDAISTLDWTFISLIRSNDTTLDFYRNGRFQSSIIIHNFQPDSNTIKIGYNGLQHFAADDVTEAFNGDIAEIIIYNNVLSEKELQDIHHYLSRKYDIEILPAPYYKRWWFYAFICFVLLLIILLLYKYKQQYQLKKQLKLLQIEKAIAEERIRISRDIHDDLGAGLSKLNLLSEVMQMNKQNTTLVDASLNSISATSALLVENMRDLVWAMNPENVTLGQLLARLREYATDYLEDFSITLSILCSDHFKDRKISSELNRHLQMMVKETLQNVVKHSSAKTVRINMKVEDKLYIEIMDDGIGFDLNHKNVGHGLKNIKVRSELIHADMQIESQSSLGTTVRISIDLKEYPVI